MKIYLKKKENIYFYQRASVFLSRALRVLKYYGPVNANHVITRKLRQSALGLVLRTQLPEPQCYACPGSPPNVAVCEGNIWVCPAAGPCTAPDASTDAASEAGPTMEAGIPDATTDAAKDGGASDAGQ